MISARFAFAVVLCGFSICDVHAISIEYSESDGYTFSEAERSAIQDIAESSESEVRSVLPQLTEGLTLQVRNGLEVIESTGESAAVVGPKRIVWIVDPGRAEGVTAIAKARLRFALFHEMHHLVRGRSAEVGHPTTLMDRAITEGLATAFARDFTSRPVDWWGEYPRNIDEWADEFVALSESASVGQWMFRHPDGRQFIGYKVGAYLVDKAMKVSGLSSAALAGASTQYILKLATEEDVSIDGVPSTEMLTSGSATLRPDFPGRDAGPSDALQTWIAGNVVAVRTIDAADEDFSDLEPLMDAIGSAQVVQLGEPSHGAGNSFAAKVRLIKFLHQRMGFDVLVWESGMHGVRLTEAGMRGGDDAVTAAQRGIFTIWSNTEEVRPLLEYAKASQSNTRPLEMAGFDMQFTAAKSFEHFAADLRSFLGAVRDPALRRHLSEHAEEALGAYGRICCARNEARSKEYADLVRKRKSGKELEEAIAAWDRNDGPKFQPKRDDLEDLHRATDALLESIDTARRSFEQVHGPKETSFMERAIENMRGHGTVKFDTMGGVRGATTATFRNGELSFNRREEQNAHNLRWLLEKEYPDRKVIVWAHNTHVINAYFAPEFRGVHIEPQPGDMKPTGVYLADWLGDKVYTIALTTFQGDDGWATSNLVTPVPAAMEGSLESRLHALGEPYLFLDLRALDANPDHVLRKAQAMRILVPVLGSSTAPPDHGNYTISDITRVFDAIFYIDQTTPATRIRGHGGARE
jgi:erythromycin esterase